MSESYLNRIIQIGGTPTPSGYVRPTGVPNGESILANAGVINSGGVNYYPIYYMCLIDSRTSRSFAKTGLGVATGADAFVFSDEPSTLYVGNTTHTFNTASDYETGESWKCRYVIMYATEANKDSASGITVNMYSYTDPIEFIGSQYLKLSSTSALFGTSTSSAGDKNLRYLNLSNSSFYNNTITDNFCIYCNALITVSLPTSVTAIGNGFLGSCYSLTAISLPNVTTVGNSFLDVCSSLKSVSLPALTTSGSFCSSCSSVTTISLPSLTECSGSVCYQCYALETISLPVFTTSSGTFCSRCYALTTVSLPALTTLSDSFCYNCYSVKSISIPALTTISSGQYFCSGCYPLDFLEIPSTVTTITGTTTDTLNYTQYIKLPTNFDIDACNFTGTSGYSKSVAWFTHLATQLKDNSGGTAKTMTLGATNIALIPSAQATIISNKNWTIN